MAFPPLFMFLFILLCVPFSSHSKLTTDYYKDSCPEFKKIILDTITTKQMTYPATAAGTLRLFFHDCFVDGCDSSVVISSNHVNTAERDAELNLSLNGDAFDVIVRAKTALELACPGVVSCSDILAQATRDLIKMVGGPFYEVRLGRKDSLISQASRVDTNLPKTNQSMDGFIKLFASKGFSVREMVALIGSHTIGFSHCKEFSNRIFNFSKTSETDPELYPKYASRLRVLCANYTTDKAMSAFNDVMSPGTFDNMYFKNLRRGLGLLSSDVALVKDERTRPFVEMYANDESVFFKDFARAMEKLSDYKVKTGKTGEVRRRCDRFNSFEG